MGAGQAGVHAGVVLGVTRVHRKVVHQYCRHQADGRDLERKGMRAVA